MDGWIDGWMDGWMDGWIVPYLSSSSGSMCLRGSEAMEGSRERTT